MKDWQPGDEGYHKATNKKFVVLQVNEDGTLKVRTADDQEKIYYPIELRRPSSTLVKRSPYTPRSQFPHIIDSSDE